MGRISDIAKSKKQAQAKELYLKEVSNTFIYEAVGIAPKTLASWVEDGGWNELKEAANITPSHIRSLILRTVQQIQRGEQPHYTPDQLSKLATAFEKITDDTKHLGYYMDAYATLGTELMKKAQAGTTTGERSQRLAFAQEVITMTDSIITHMINN